MATYIGITALNRSQKIRVPAVTVSGRANEVQHITVDATGGTFTVSYGGETTSAQAFNVSAAALQNALTGFAGLQEGDVVVTGGPGAAGGATPYILTFGGSLAGTNVAAVTTNAGSLTGGAGTAAVTTPTAGAAGTASSALTTLVPGTVTVVDISDVKVRKALNSHDAFGGWVVVAAHNAAGGVTLPANT